MRKPMLASIFAIVFSSSAFGAASACVTYADTNDSPVQFVYSCDGAPLQNLFTATGISAGLSRAIPYFMDKGYDLSGCTEIYSPATETAAGYSYSRCIFTKK